MIASQRQHIATDMAEGKAFTAFLMKVEWILLGAGVVLCAILGTIITRWITKPINRIIAGLNDVAGAEESASAAEQLSAQGVTVKNTVEKLATLIWGKPKARYHQSATAQGDTQPGQKAFGRQSGEFREKGRWRVAC